MCQLPSAGELEGAIVLVVVIVFSIECREGHPVQRDLRVPRVKRVECGQRVVEGNRMACAQKEENGN